MSNSPDLISTALKMLASLTLVLGGMLVVFYFMKRSLNRGSGFSGANVIRVLANTYIGVKKSIALVEIPGALLVIGISNDNISLLTKIEDENVLNRFSGSYEEGTQLSFPVQLHRLAEKLKIRFPKG